MSDPSPSIQGFFEHFERLTGTGTPEELAGLYAPAFLMAGPNGTQVVKASDLVHVIPRRKQMFAAAGCTSTKLVSVDETRVDDRYSLVRTEWQWRFVRGAEAPVDVRLPSTFMVERSSVGPQIVCYIAHADIAAVLRERGLLPS